MQTFSRTFLLPINNLINQKRVVTCVYIPPKFANLKLLGLKFHSDGLSQELDFKKIAIGEFNLSLLLNFASRSKNDNKMIKNIFMKNCMNCNSRR